MLDALREKLFPISIHALREEGDEMQGNIGQLGKISIHALREEGDSIVRGFSFFWQNFYPRPPRGGRPDRWLQTVPGLGFLSTPSARRATSVRCS